VNILFAGDSPVGGAANYLLGILNHVRANCLHIPPGKCLQSKHVKHGRDVIILSDYSAKDVSRSVQGEIVEQVRSGAGLLMIGGWGSFSGPFGHWQGTAIESLLPVVCSKTDDRLNFPSGALMLPTAKHAAIRGVNFGKPPIIAGLNKTRAKQGSVTVLEARPIEVTPAVARRGYQVGLKTQGVPLLVVSEAAHPRTAALMTDLAPHWCGGMLDWGQRRVKMKVNSEIWVETGHLYVQFVASLLKWLGSNLKNKNK